MTATLRSIQEQFAFWNKAVMPEALKQSDKVQIVIGCGTSYNLALSVAAAMSGKGIRAMAVPAGEWLVRPDAYYPGANVEVIALSRSGETTETVLAAQDSQRRGQRVTGITCAPGSALSAAVDRAIEFETHAEEGIVMTASASLMLVAGFALAGFDISANVTSAAEAMLKRFGAVPVAPYAKRTHFVFLGGGANYGAALEGALKLQEMAICFTQGFHPGEYRHGPVSLIDQHSAVVMIYHDDTRADEIKLVAELQEKGAWVLGLGGPGDVEIGATLGGDLAAIEVLPVLQLLGERYAEAKGIDTTAPRNLTKVVKLAN